MTPSQKKGYEILGQSLQKSHIQIRKLMLFHCMQKCGMDTCFQCGEKITDINTLSIEHKIAWMGSENPKEMFWDVNNLAFSHLRCNSIGIKNKNRLIHPSVNAYVKRGCRCEECTNLYLKRKESEKKYSKKYKKKKQQNLTTERKKEILSNVEIHPSYRTYDLGCRCEKCREFMRTKKEKYRRSKRIQPIKPRTHPSISAYDTYGCRCDECKTLKREKGKQYRLKKKQQKLTATKL